MYILGQMKNKTYLNILIRVTRALIRAAHQVHVVQLAEARVRDAFELGRGGDAAVRRLGAPAQRQGLDLGQQDGILGFCGRQRRRRGEEGEDGQVGGEERGEVALGIAHDFRMGWH